MGSSGKRHLMNRAVSSCTRLPKTFCSLQVCIAIVLAVPVCRSICSAQPAPDGILQLAESIKSDVAAGNVTQARGKIQQIVSMVEAMCGKDSVEYASMSLMLAYFVADAESPKAAIELAKDSLAKLEASLGATDPSIAMGYATLCALYWRANQPRLALEAGQRALEACKGLPESEARNYERNTLLYMAQAESSRGDYEAAETYFERLEKVPRDSADKVDDVDEISLLSSKAGLLAKKGEFAASEEMFLQCLKKLGAREDSQLGLSISQSLGDLYMAVGDADRADASCRKAAEMAKSIYGETSIAYASALGRVARVCLEQNKLEDARKIVLQAIDCARNVPGGSDKMVEAGLLCILASVDQESNDLDSAQRNAKQAVDLYADGENMRATSDAQQLLAGILLEKGDLQEALRINQQCLDTLSHTEDQASPVVVSLLGQQGRIYRGMGDDKKALEIAEKLDPLVTKQNSKVFTMDERTRLAWRPRWLSFGYEVCLLPPEKVADMVLRQKGTVLDSVMEDRALAREILGDKSAKKIFSEIARIRSQVSMLAFSSDPEDRKDAESLLRKASELERSLAKTRASRTQTNRSFQAKAADVRAVLGSDEALVDFIVFKDPKLPKPSRRCYGAVVMSGPDAPVSFVRIDNADAVDAAVDRSRKAIAQGGEQELYSALTDVSEKLWKPVAAKIPPECKKLLLAPDGALNFFSFAVIPTGEGRLVADDYLVSYLGSSRDVLRQGSPPKSKKAVVFADPLFDASRGREASGAKIVQRSAAADIYGALQLPQLPGAKVEGQIVKVAAAAAGWDPEVFEGKLASETGLREVSSPGILHLATHGFYLNSDPSAASGSRGMSVVPTDESRDDTEPLGADGVDPMKASGIALTGAQTTLRAWSKNTAPEADSDGILTAEEVAALDLENTWLVALSACETGVGEARSGEGVLGLRRAFMMSGAQNLLMTLWPVNDAATSEMMRDFYKEVFATGNAPVSLATVQRAWLCKITKEKGLLAAVRDAGPFVMVVMAGSPGANAPQPAN